MDTSPTPITPKPVPMFLAGLLVFFTSFVTLVLEIIGSRLLAPYIGVTLQTYTAVIGTILAGISIGTWLGGSIADRLNPRRLIGPLLIVGGIFVLLTVPIARWFGPTISHPGAALATLLSISTLFAPAAVLSAINPTVVKIQLSSLSTTGRTVGHLSAVATAGAIIGTFATGFFLVATFPVARVLALSGAAILIVGVSLTAFVAQPRKTTPVAVAFALLAGATGVQLTLSSQRACDVESSYTCIRVLHDRDRPTGRVLKLDNQFNSYQDLKDPSYLGFSYLRMLAGVVNTAYPESQPLKVMSLGAGAVTLPRYIAATRPASQNDVLEIDPALVKVDKANFGLRLSPALTIRVGDARTTISSYNTGYYDVVVGDAFGSDSPPWQLTTLEFNQKIQRVLKTDGIYAMNLIDGGPQDLVRAEVKTLQKTFKNVAVVGRDNGKNGLEDGNIEVVAAKGSFDPSQLEAHMRADDKIRVLVGSQVDAYAGNARALTDDFAPVDQLITR